MNTFGRRNRPRRRLLAATATGAMTALAGCGHLINAIRNVVLEEVNLFNAADRRRRGTLTGKPHRELHSSTPALTCPRTRMNKLLMCQPTIRQRSRPIKPTQMLTAAGEYTISVALDTDSAIDEARTDTEPAQIAAPSDKQLAVYLHSREGTPATTEPAA